MPSQTTATYSSQTGSLLLQHCFLPCSSCALLPALTLHTSTPQPCCLPWQLTTLPRAQHTVFCRPSASSSLPDADWIFPLPEVGQMSWWKTTAHMKAFCVGPMNNYNSSSQIKTKHTQESLCPYPVLIIVPGLPIRAILLSKLPQASSVQHNKTHQADAASHTARFTAWFSSRKAIILVSPALAFRAHHWHFTGGHHPGSCKALYPLSSRWRSALISAATTPPQSLRPPQLRCPVAGRRRCLRSPCLLPCVPQLLS